MSRYKNFPCCEMPLPDGGKVHVLLIPEEDSMSKSVGITNVVGYIGTPENGEHPPNSIFVCRKIFELEDYKARIAEAIAYAFVKMFQGEEGIFFYKTAGGTVLEKVIEKLLKPKEGAMVCL